MGTAADMWIEENMALSMRRGQRRTLRPGITGAERAEYKRQLATLGLGLEDRMTSKVGLLSGGQRQRLTIARALVGHPDILILDDSASALDYATDAALRKALRTLPAETTLFIVSQRTSSLRHADQIIVLDDGHVVGIGTHDALMQTCEVYREIHESQFRKGSDVQ